MLIKRAHTFSLVIIFLIISCSFVFASDVVRIAGEFYMGEGHQVDALDKKLKSLDNFKSIPVVELPDNSLKTQRSTLSEDTTGPPQIGFAKNVESLSTPQHFKHYLNWHELQNGGFTAKVIINSPGARALRVGMIINQLPKETEFRFFRIDKDYPAVALITGNQINKLLMLNQRVDADHPDSNTYWSPTVPGESIGIEIYLPSLVDPDTLDIAIPFLSHIFDAPYDSEQEFSTIQNYGDSSSCQNDISCYPNLGSIGTSVAKMVYTESGDSYECTGTLLTDTVPNTYRPYFITANHCISTQTVASTLETYWFFESAWCNGSTRNSNYSINYGGATLLWTKGNTTYILDSNQDVSFLELNNPPPAGVTYSGWDISIEPGPVTGIHHPAGDWKKISFGDQVGNYKCYDTVNDSYDCAPSSNGSFLSVLWSDGGTEGGSSGSGLFNVNNQLVGVLLGGVGDCAGSESDYSKFGAAYSAGNLSRWLDPDPCTYSISSFSTSFSSFRETRTVSITASSSNCSWITSEDLSWLYISPTSGTGSGTVTITATQNFREARTGSITIAGETYTISQEARSYTKATLTNPAPGSALTGSSVLFQWDSVGANEYFLYVGTTPGDNDLFNSSTGTSTSITVTGLPADGSQLYVTLWTRFVDWESNAYTYTAYQTPCTYSISPSSGSFTSNGGSASVSVRASSSSCSWTTSENLSWVSLSPTNGTGSRDVTVSVTANTGSARSGSVTIAGKTYTISQDKTPEQTAVILSSTSTNHIITTGSDDQIYGTATSNQITLESGAQAELINFPGQNSIQIQSSSDLFTVSRSGTVVTFEGSDGTILKIPATTDPQSISFNGEESRVLQIDNGRVMLDDQEINLTPVVIN
jgi:hypothetical protein